MKPAAYSVSLISADAHIQRTIVAHSSLQAGMIGLDTMPEQHKPFALICKPLCELPDTRSEPCAA